jgi:hypothetical protein
MKKAAWLILSSVILLFVADCAVSYPRFGPPPPREEVYVGQPGYVWINGYWAWSGGHYYWVRGHWARVRPGRAWVNGHWELMGTRWVYVRGYWR